MEISYVWGPVGAVAALFLFLVVREGKKGFGEAMAIRKIKKYVPASQFDLASMTPYEQRIEYLRVAASKLANIRIFFADAISLWNICEEGTRPLLVMIMGEFKTGKSTFINTILGEDVLTVDAAPATAVSSLIRYGTERRTWLHYQNGETEEYPFEKLSEITAEGDESKRELRESLAYVEIALDNELLKRINLIDTPGLNVHRESHIKNTEDFKRRADVVLWVFNATRSATRTEIQEIKSLSKRLKPFAVVNRIDNIDEEEESVEEVLDNIRGRLGDTVQAVYGVSTRLAQEAFKKQDEVLLESSGWKNFSQNLEAHFISRADELKLISLADKIEEFSAAYEAKLSSLNEEIDQKKSLFDEGQNGTETLNNELRCVKDIIKSAREIIESIDDTKKTHKDKVKNANLTRDILHNKSFSDNIRHEMLGFIGALQGFTKSVASYISKVEKLKNKSSIIDDLELMCDELKKQSDRFHQWREESEALVAEKDDLEDEMQEVDRQKEEYMQSGFFGGEPIFDFSGKRKRYYKSEAVYKEHESEYWKRVDSHVGKFTTVCADTASVADDAAKIVRKAEKTVAGRIREIEWEIKKIQKNYKGEQKKYNKMVEDITLGNDVLSELRRYR